MYDSTDHNYSEGISPLNEDRYQATLKALPHGLVLALETGAPGEVVVHKTTCQTISYSLVNARNQNRTPKMIFRDAAAMQNWITKEPKYKSAKLNHCSKCMPVADRPARPPLSEAPA